MSLSVTTAAEESPQRLALIVDGQGLSFADLAARVASAKAALARRASGPARALVCQPTLESLVALYACFELQIPVALLSPKLTAHRGTELRQAIAAFRPDADALAIVFTSGTSGEPKGVELSRRAFEAAAAASAANLGWRDDDRWLLGLSFAHIGGLSIVTRCLAARRPVVMAAGERFSALELAQTIEGQRVTLLSLVPTQLHQLLGAGHRPAPLSRVPTHLRAVLLGGAATDPGLLQRAREGGWPVLATYGMTETCSQLATQPLSDLGRSEVAEGAPPLPGVELRIEGGAIQVRSPALLTRYQPRDSHPDPRDADGWFATNDLGRLDANGRLHVLGRRDELIVTGGEKVIPQEVERVIAGCPGVRAVCVFGIADPEWGQLVAAAIVPDQEPPSHELLREALAAQLASHQRPRRLAILAEFPATASGKIDRRALARLNPAELTPLRFS